MHRYRPLRTLAAVLFLASAPAIGGPLDLPEIGDRASMVLPEQEAARVGRDALRQLRDAGKLIEEPGLKRYLDDLGHRLAAAGDGARQFTFFIVDDPSINAFAMPGGFVGVNAGLIQATRSEDELAAVLAHEIAHVTQRHLERGVEESGKASLPIAAAMIAAILLAGKNAQMGEAAMATTIAGATQSQLNFTREHEQEADRIGMRMLVGAGFDAKAMPGFFERLKQETRYYATGLPEFLSTHPVNDSRIADTRARAEQLASARHRSESTAYGIAKAQLRVQLARDPRDLVNRIAGELKSGSYDNLEALRFAHALALERIGDHDGARRTLTELLGKQPKRVAYLEALARSELAAGDARAALGTYKEGLALYPGNAELSLGYADTLLRTGDNAKALSVLDKLSARGWPEVYQLQAKAASQAGNQAESHFHLAEYYEASGDLTSALQQLRLARKGGGDDFYLASRIDAKMTQVETADRERSKKH